MSSASDYYSGSAVPPTSAYGPPKIDFTPLANGLQTYVQGKQLGRQEDQAEAFRNGIPRINNSTDPNAPFDMTKVADITARNNPTLAEPFIKMQAEAQAGKKIGNSISWEGGPPQPQYQPQAPQGRGQPASVAAPPMRPAVGGGDQPGSLVGTLTDAGVPPEKMGEYLPRFSGAFKISDSNSPMNPQQTQLVKQQLSKMGYAGGPQEISPQAPQTTSQPAPQTPVQRIAQGKAAASAQSVADGKADAADESTSPFGNAADARRLLQSAAKRDALVAATPFVTKQQEEMAKSASASERDIAKKIFDYIGEADKPSPEQKLYDEAKANGEIKPGTTRAQFAADQAAGAATATETAKANVEEQQGLIKQGVNAEAKLGTINTMTNIIKSAKNLDLGFGSEATLKIKMALEKAGFPTGDLSGAQLLDKYNKALAAESTKGVTARGTNFEMKTFSANNPGLGMDEKGNIRMLGIMAQNAKREADIGNLARQHRGNWDNWPKVVREYDEKNPIKDPTTGHVLSNHSIIAPAPEKKGATPATSTAGSAQAAPMVSSKADYDKLPSGAKFTGPDGKPWRKP